MHDPRARMPHSAHAWTILHALYTLLFCNKIQVPHVTSHASLCTCKSGCAVWQFSANIQFDSTVASLYFLLFLSLQIVSTLETQG